MYLLKRALYRVADSLKLIALIYVISLLVAGGLFAYAENKPYGQGVWWAVVTALTIGYGDMYPVTLAGKIIAVFFNHLWILGITPMVIANVFFKLMRNKNDWTHREQEWLMNSVERIAAGLTVPLPPQPNATNDGDVISTDDGQDRFIND